ncbi:unannotated protein [freshwater metagenome]|uniref:Unannotated protein n=1 Tax=freshwater metagenome TaxID=449393 RepID=A0A6J6KC28_9ZZZZ
MHRMREFVSGFFQSRKSLLLAIPVIGVIFLMSSSTEHRWTPNDIVINEVMTSNSSTLQDSDGDSPDWIELWNPTDRAISLEGYQLIHDETDQWTFPNLTLPPDEFLIVYASGKNRTQGELHTNFLLSRTGEAVELHHPSGVNRFDIPELSSNASFGRQLMSPGKLCFFAYPTPASRNAPECFRDNALGAPTLSHASGFYDASFALDVDPAEQEFPLFYTIDGSFPDPISNPEKTLRYTGPISIAAPDARTGPLSYIDTTITDPTMRYSEIFRNKPQTSSTIQPAATLRVRSLYSAETSATFFIGEQHSQALPVVSLLLNPAHFFDSDSGIYIAGTTFTQWRNSNLFDPNSQWATPANYTGIGREWERPHTSNVHDAVRFQYCTPMACEDAINVGVRTHGNASLIQPMRSLRLYARNDYRTPRFTTDFFGKQYSGWSTIILRNGGNNQRGFSDRFHFNDMYFQSTMEGLTASTQNFQAVNVYVNGEYWGIHQLGERYDEQFLATKYGIDADNAVLVDLNDPEDTPQEILDAWQELLTSAQTLPPIPNNRLVLEELMDIESFFDYVVAHTYVGNSDWPTNNTMMWRSITADGNTPSTFDDQRWRWMITDLDRVGGSNDDPDVNVRTLLTRIGPGSQAPQAQLLHGLLRFPELRLQFFERYAFHLDYTFSPHRMRHHLRGLVDEVRNEMPRHEQRWLPMGNSNDFMTWMERVDQVRNFVSQRSAVMREQLLVAQNSW